MMEPLHTYPPTLVIDRIEEGYALCETPDKALLRLPLRELPDQAAPGDVLELIEARYQINPEQTAKRREQNYHLFRSIFKEP